MGKTIKLCYVSTFAYPLFNPKCKKKFGGAEKQMYLIAKEVAKDNNFSVYFLTGNFGQKLIEEHDNVLVLAGHSLEKKLINYIKEPIRMYFKLRLIDPDVVIQRCASAETGISALYCLFNRKKFIYSVASKYDINGKFASKPIIGWLFRFGLKMADGIIMQNKKQVEIYNER